MRRLDLKRLTFNRSLFIAGGTLLAGAALGWAQPPLLVILAVGVIGVGALLYGLHQIETPSPCGDPKVRRNRIRDHAKHLKWELEHFETWRPALEDKNFKGKLPPGSQRTTHAKAMQALLSVFAKFFSAVRTYEVQCPQQARPEERLMKRVREVYDALGLNRGGDTDEVIDSMDLHAIGECSTRDWGKAEARPFTEVELRAAVRTNPLLDESLEPLREFLLIAAGPGIEARSRLGKTAEALGRVAEEPA